jgi:hypothetical protein
MSQLITIQSGRRSLAPAGERAFQLAYESTGILESDFKPIIRFSKDAADIIRQVSECRKKEYRTTTRWNEAADYTGLLGELAVQRYLGISPETALADFTKGLHQGDRGHDVVANGLKLDVKSTKGDALKFKFSKTNRYTALADGYIFVYVEHSGLEVWCHLLGYSHRAEVKPYQRDDGQRLFVRVETLRRAGVLNPVSQLKESNQTVTNPQPINQ